MSTAALGGFHRGLRGLQPFRSALSIGLVSDAELTPGLLNLRQEAATCVERRRARDFVQVCAKAARQLEALPRSHRLFFDKHLMFIRAPSPVAPLFDAIMSKVFNKSCDFDDACELHMESTSSGYAMDGLRGTGKSQTLRLCSVLAPVLLPNVVSAYVDAEAHMLCDPLRPGFTPSTTPFTMLHDAYLARHPTALLIEGESVVDVNSLVTNAARLGLVSMLAVDELRSVYPSAEIWSQLHQLATHSATALFVADSTARLRPMVKGDSDTRSALITKRWFGVTRPSLNDTKLALVTLPPLSSADQYESYLRARIPPQVLEELQIDVDGLHLLTNGRIRSIMNLLTSFEEYRQFAQPPALPLPGSWERYVLDQLKALQAAKGGFSPFNVESVPFEGVAGWWASWQKGEGQREEPEQDRERSRTAEQYGDLWAIVDDLVQGKVLAQVMERGEPRYTFAAPLQYCMLTNMVPNVFISHDMTDFEAVKEFRTVLQTSGAAVTVCEDPAAKASMIDGLEAWMHRQMQFVQDSLASPRNFCVILLTEAYMKKLADMSSNNGCKTEVNAACDQLKRLTTNAESAGRLLVVRAVPFEKINEYEKKSSLLRTVLAHGPLIPDVADQQDVSALLTRIIAGYSPR